MRVAVVGGGFGGLSAAQAISKINGCQVSLIDRRNFHLFQPLLYQVAMAGLNPADIAVPLRAIFRKQRNVNVILAEVDGVDVAQIKIKFDGAWHRFDYLVLACGAKHFYFGKKEWEEFAPGLKNIEQATEIRRRVLMAFELAEKEPSFEVQTRLLTFVVVGGGPTGVELAGAIAEMASRTLYRDYRHAQLKRTRVILVEAGPRILSSFPESLSLKASGYLEKLGVEVIENCRADGLSSEGLRVGDNFVNASTIIWAAGVKPSSLNEKIATPKEQSGRAIVEKDLSLPGSPNVFVIGDQGAFIGEDQRALPGIAPVANQQGAFLAKVIRADLNQLPRPQFRYFDKGIMATVGRTKAVAHVDRFKFGGFLAWAAWVLVHIVYLMRFRNKFFVFMQWVWAYFTFGRGARLITYNSWKFYSGEPISMVLRKK
ncbi:MAG: FAD-dependent oxidoreductase [Bdellovibrionales bacterium CG10_big_fil_rev_8_21_14_0_10_45_34]|nr:MAG: FAD-dependent oxidoreductase [Bdellovibrionales bacterium CG10_big_fil_rev_8_21_14_0_10_45_34]